MDRGGKIVIFHESDPEIFSEKLPIHHGTNQGGGVSLQGTERQRPTFTVDRYASP